MAIPIAIGSTDITVNIRILDSTTFLPLTTVSYASVGLDLWYRKGALGAEVSITEVTQTITGAHTDGGFVHVSDGVCRLDLPDAAVPTAEHEIVEVGGTVTGGIVMGVALVGRVVPLAPTVAGRTLDVSAGGAAGIDLANVENQGTTLTLSGTTVKTATDVETDTADIQTRIPATLVTGRIDASVGAVATGAITAGGIAADAIGASELAADAVAEIAAAVWAYATRTLTQGAASIVTAVTGTTISAYKGGYFSATLTGLTDFTGWKRIYFTVKRDPLTEADSAAMLQLCITNPGSALTDGLLYAGGASATKTDGSITVNSTTSITVVVKNAGTALLEADTGAAYDVWVINASDQPVPVSEGGRFVTYPAATIAAS